MLAASQLCKTVVQGAACPALAKQSKSACVGRAGDQHGRRAAGSACCPEAERMDFGAWPKCRLSHPAAGLGGMATQASKASRAEQASA